MAQKRFSFIVMITFFQSDRKFDSFLFLNLQNVGGGAKEIYIPSLFFKDFLKALFIYLF